MPRGRLINPMYCTIARLDTATMGTSGYYDDEYREVIKVDSDADGIGEDTRQELTNITVPAQIERDREELQRMTRAGNIPDSAVGIVLHMKQMERDGLVNADGSFNIGVNDRLVQIADKQGNVVNTFTNPELYCTHAKRLQAELGSRSNAALFLFEDQRPKGLA